MRSQKGVTLTSLIIYVVAMVIVVATIAVITRFFYGNLDSLSNRGQASKSYTLFNSYFTNEINTPGNEVINCDETTLVFKTGNQYKITGKSIYMNKIKICDVDAEGNKFIYDTNDKDKVSVELRIDVKNFTNAYKLKSK